MAALSLKHLNTVLHKTYVEIVLLQDIYWHGGRVKSLRIKSNSKFCLLLIYVYTMKDHVVFGADD